MSVSTELERIRTGIHNTYIALEEKGATLPETESLSNLANTVATVPSGGDIGNTNVYTLSFLQEIEEDIHGSSLIRAGLVEVDILHNNDTLSPVRDTWVFKPANMEERFRDILTSEHAYAETKFTEILGEINE